VRIIINRTLALGQKTGIGHYTAQLLRSLKEQAGPDDQIASFPNGWLWRLGQGLSRPVVAQGQKSVQMSRPSWRHQTLVALRNFRQACLTRSLQKCLARGSFDLYHEPNAIPLPCDVPTMATIHDLSLLAHPQWHPAARVAHFEKNVSAITRCVHLLADTEFTRQEAMRLLNLPGEQITRVYLGVHPGMRPLSAEATAAGLRRLGLLPGYLLYVGTIEPRKNLLLLLQAYCSLPARLRQAPLVLAGSWGWSSNAVADYYHAHARGCGVLRLGYVADDDLPILYNGARALVYPSHYEGFGLPPLEMMACGGAVLASTADAVVETAGAKAHMIEPHDQDAWRAALARVLSDDDWWHVLRDGTVELARRFSWDRCATETLQVYRSLVHPVRRAA
jgi:alpha-1,3-rhamnosyl/mannosyltransferase